MGEVASKPLFVVISIGFTGAIGEGVGAGEGVASGDADGVGLGAGGV
jgi:hypothetical protein